MKKIIPYLIAASVIGTSTYAADGVINVEQKPRPNPMMHSTSTVGPVAQIAKSFTPPPSININAAAWVLINYQTGKILSEHDAHEIRKPASLVKIMTAYIVAQALKDKSISWDDVVPVSTKAWKTGGSKMFIKPGQKVTVGELMQGMIVQSGNDATVALSEFIAGSEQAFVGIMNHTAQKLGMKNTHFENSDGLPADGQQTTAYDMMLLARAFISHFPGIYKIYSQKSFTWNGISQNNRNKLLYTNPDVDGMKTGYTDKAGYNLVSSAKHNDQRLISVVLGAPSARARADDSNKLLTYGFRFYTTVELFKQGDIITELPVKKSKTLDDKVSLYATQPVIVSIPKGSEEYVHKNISLKSEITAPIKSGDMLGTLNLSLGKETIATVPLAAKNNIAKAGFFTQMTNKVKSWF